MHIQNLSAPAVFRADSTDAMNLHLPVHMHNPFEPAVFRAKPTFLLAAVPELADPEFRARQLRAMQASSNDTVDLVACCDVVDLSEDDPPAALSVSGTLFPMNQIQALLKSKFS